MQLLAVHTTAECTWMSIPSMVRMKSVVSVSEGRVLLYRTDTLLWKERKNGRPFKITDRWSFSPTESEAAFRVCCLHRYVKECDGCFLILSQKALCVQAGTQKKAVQVVWLSSGVILWLIVWMTPADFILKDSCLLMAKHHGISIKRQKHTK